MSQQDQIKHLADELDKLIDSFRIEWDLPYASVVGVLSMKVQLLCEEAAGRDGQD